MSVFFLVLPLAMIMAAAALFAFLRAIRAGQFDDLDTPQWRAIFTDETIPPATDSKTRRPRPDHSQ